METNNSESLDNVTILPSDIVEYNDINSEFEDDVKDYFEDIDAYNSAITVKEEVEGVLVALEGLMDKKENITPYVVADTNSFYLDVCARVGATPINTSLESNTPDINISVENLSDILSKIIDGIKKLLSKIIFNIKKLYLKLLTIINNDETIIKLLLSEVNNKLIKSGSNKDKVIADLSTLFSTNDEIKVKIYNKIAGIALVSDISSKNILEVIDLYSKHIIEKQSINPAPTNFTTLEDMINVQNMYKFIPTALINIKLSPALPAFNIGAVQYYIINANEDSLGILSVCSVKEHIADLKYTRHKLTGLSPTKSNYDNPYHRISRYNDYYIGNKDFSMSELFRMGDIVHNNSSIIKLLYTNMNNNIKILENTTANISKTLEDTTNTVELNNELQRIQKVTSIIPHIYVDDMLSILKLNKVLIGIIKIANQNLK